MGDMERVEHYKKTSLFTQQIFRTAQAAVIFKSFLAGAGGGFLAESNADI
jgi:hypothetical protein